MAAKDLMVKLSDFTTEGYPINGKKKNAIVIEELSIEDINNNKLNFQIVGNNLEITDTTSGKKLLVSNYTGITKIKTDYVKTGKKESYTIYDLIVNNAIDNTLNIISTYNKSYKATGATNYNDKFNYSKIELTTKNNKGLTIDGKKGNDIIIGSNYNDKITGGAGDDEITGGAGNDTITGGDGNDIITGGLGNDTITGGKGINEIYYSKGDGDDVITLTKGEEFFLNIKDLNIEDLEIAAVNKNKDLKISYDKDGVKGSVTLKTLLQKMLQITEQKRQATQAKLSWL